MSHTIIGSIKEEKDNKAGDGDENTEGDTHGFFQPHKSTLTRNLSLVPDHMLMNRNKKVKDSGGSSNEDSGT